jgi:hypothetical protein
MLGLPPVRGSDMAVRAATSYYQHKQHNPER